MRRLLALLLALCMAPPVVVLPVALLPTVADARGFRSSSFRSSRSSWRSSRSSYRSSSSRSSRSSSSWSGSRSKPSSSSSRSSRSGSSWSGSRSRPSTSSRSSSRRATRALTTGFGRRRSGRFLAPRPLATRATRVGGSWGTWVVIGFGGVLLVVALVVVIVSAQRAQRRRQQLVSGGRAIGSRGTSQASVGPPVEPPPGPRPLEADGPDYWLHLQQGDRLAVSDVVAFADALDNGRGTVHGTDYELIQLTRCAGPAGEQVVLALCDDGQQPLLLMVEKGREGTTLRLLHKPPGAPAGNRADLLDAGAFWLFSEPPNPEAFRPADLRYTPDIIQEGKGGSLVDANASVELRFDQDRDGERVFRASQTPIGPDGPAFPLRLVCWRCSDATAAADPYLVVVERGGQGRREGGHVELWQGCDVRPSDLDITPA